MSIDRELRSAQRKHHGDGSDDLQEHRALSRLRSAGSSSASISRIEANLLAQSSLQNSRYYFGDLDRILGEIKKREAWGWVYCVTPDSDDSVFSAVVSRQFGFAFLYEQLSDEPEPDWPALIDIRKFVLDYTQERDHTKIKFAWNGRHAQEFRASNIEFRNQVTSSICEDFREVSLQLIMDLFEETSKCSKEAWGSFPRYGELCGHLLRVGKVHSFPHAFHWRSVCMDTWMTSETPSLLIEEIDELRRDLPAIFADGNIHYESSEVSLDKALEYLDTVEEMQEINEYEPRFRRSLPID
ncbi:MAG: hypothetical protein P1V97_15140 [Planctomycetota bacterium]|nr:hypothetical protein [Planctomycetota bacterium]